MLSLAILIAPMGAGCKWLFFRFNRRPNRQPRIVILNYNYSSLNENNPESLFVRELTVVAP